MKMNRVVIAALVAGGAVAAVKMGGCLSSKDPDEKFGGHVEDICKIARDGAGKPVAGVKKLGHFLADHAGDMAKEYVDTIALIELIEDDGKHDDRARLAHERMVGPLVDCIKDLENFLDAIEGNEEASALVNHTMERIDRTLNIIGGGLRSTVLQRKLPAQLFPLRR
jgi:hypothetical protein